MALTSLTNLQPLHVHSVGVSTFDGSVSVGGTLTYEDVTNVDAIGIVTARSGVNVSGGQLDVGSSIKLGNAGVITATSFVGSGANLTSLPSQVTIANNADNRVITGGSGTNLNGEANLTFNGTTLDLNGTANILKSDSSGFHVLLRNTNNTNGNQAELRFQGTNSSNGGYTTARIVATNLDNYNQYSDLRFFTHSLGSTTEKLRITSDGKIGINTTAPAHLLDIKNETSAGGIRLRSTGNFYHDIVFDAGRLAANQHIGRLRAMWNGNNSSMISMNTGSDVTNKDNGYISFCAAEAGSTLTERFRCAGGAAGLVMQNDCYIEIPHDERCIVFDEGQKMITSNDGQGNFNMFGGKNHDGVHVSSSSGNSGISQMEINSDGSNGSVHFAVGPIRSAGSSATFEKGFRFVYHTNSSSDRLNGFKYTTGSSTSPSGLGTEYNILHKGNASDGTWARVSGDGFKVLGDGGSIAITTNDGYGNCNLCFNHKDGVPDTAGSSWRIRCDIDAANSDMNFQTAASVSNGSAVSTGSRMVLASNGNLQIDGGYSSSDRRLKTNIQTITGATDKIKALTGKTFKWKDGLEMPSGTKYGFIAQEVESVVPDLVDESRIRGFDKDGNIIQDHYHNKDDIVEWGKGVDDSGIIPILVESLKEAIAKIETLEDKVAALEGS